MVGALVLDDVLGDAEAVLGGELLQARSSSPGRRRARTAASISGSKSRCTTGRRPVEAAAEVDGADHGLDGVGEDRGLVAAAGGLLAAAELDVLAEADAAADLGQRAGVDDRGAQLGQPALGEVGVGAVERLGDDDAEHGVAEELQPLVGRQAAVLVGVRAVGQGALEQRSRVQGLEASVRGAPASDGCGVVRSAHWVGPAQNLATVLARAVLAAVAARAVRQLCSRHRSARASP